MSCCVLCRNGEILAYSMQKVILHSMNWCAPAAAVQFCDDERLYKIVEKMMRILNWSGVACVDLIYDEADQQHKILEINPRYWGSLLGSLFARVNFPHLACLVAMGIELPSRQYEQRTYLLPQTAIRLALTGWCTGYRGCPSIRGTGIRYWLEDPLPEVFKGLDNACSRVLRRRDSCAEQVVLQKVGN